MDSNPERDGQNSERDAKTGRFLPGNKGGPPGVSGRKKAEFRFQAILDEEIAQEEWRAMIRLAKGRALNPEARFAFYAQHAFEWLTERRFGKVKDEVDIRVVRERVRELCQKDGLDEEDTAAAIEAAESIVRGLVG